MFFFFFNDYTAPGLDVCRVGSRDWHSTRAKAGTMTRGANIKGNMRTKPHLHVVDNGCIILLVIPHLYLQNRVLFGHHMGTWFCPYAVAVAWIVP